jgi:uncharacterized protein YaiI (UPF0178 family)
MKIRVEITGGPAPFSASDQKAFAGQLDRLLARWQRAQGSPGQVR